MPISLKSLRQSCDRYFNLAGQNSSPKIELAAGLTTFLTMCYIVVVNPMILGESGMDQAAVFVATCLAAAIGSFIMGALANYPIALAPGLGLNAYFTYSVVLGMHVPWTVALAAVFCSGLLFLVLSYTSIREKIINEMPDTLKYSIGAGIGLFLAMIALSKLGLIVSNPVTLVSLGDLTRPEVGLGLLGFLLIIVFSHFKIKSAIILSILIITAISYFAGMSAWHGIVGPIPSLSPTLMQLDFSQLLNSGLLTVIFIFFLVDLFDSTGVLIGVSERAGLLQNGKLPRLKRALFADSLAIPIGAVLGTSSTTAYVESISGVAAGGKTGLTAIVAGLFFLLTLWFYPLVSAIPAYATFPALLYIAVLMMKNLTFIHWDDLTEAAPALFTIIFMPLCYSIAEGIAAGFISYAVIKLCCGKGKSVSFMVWIIAALWTVKLIFWP